MEEVLKEVSEKISVESESKRPTPRRGKIYQLPDAESGSEEEETPVVEIKPQGKKTPIHDIILKRGKRDKSTTKKRKRSTSMK